MNIFPVICNELEDPSSSCSLDEGRVQLRNGMVYTSSGGTCVSPNVCEGCNPGYYVDGSYCKGIIDNVIYLEVYMPRQYAHTYMQQFAEISFCFLTGNNFAT